MPFRKDFCCGFALCPYCYDAIRNTNRNNSAPHKKWSESDLGILSAKCEQHETEQGSEKSKIFLVKISISLSVQLKSYFFWHFGYP